MPVRGVDERAVEVAVSGRRPVVEAVDDLAGIDPTELAQFYELAGGAAPEDVAWWLGGGWQYRERPVDVQTFLFDRSYMAALDESGRPILWPRVVEAIEAICGGRFVECVLTGGIGVGKSSIALYVTAYKLYELLCLRDPHATHDLDPSSEIVMVFQSLSANLARDVDYGRLRSMCERAPLFQRDGFRFNREMKSRMEFDNNVRCMPVAGTEEAVLSQNMIGGIIDELGSMAVVERSLRTRDRGTYDQAVKLYTSIAMRRESRFLRLGELPGMLCLVGSRKYPDDFLHAKLREAADRPDRIYVYDERVWDVKPWHYGKERFRVFVGDATRKPRILDADDGLGADGVVEVPVELRPSFERDLLSALRDVAGVANLSTHPYILDRDKLAAAFGVVESVASREACDFEETTVDLFPSRWEGTEGFPRYAHFDLARTQCSAGLAVGHVRGFRSIRRSRMVEEVLPVVRYDLVLEVVPPKNGEICYEKIRRLLYLLREHGMPITWASADQFQCIAGGSNVWTGRGMVAARDVVVGDVVQSRTGPASVTKAWSFGVQPCIRMTTTDGHELTMTGRHRIEVLTRPRNENKRPTWKRADRLKVGDVVRTWDVPREPAQTRIKSLEPCTADVYDFAVSGDPSYVVNGLVSHNSVDMLQILEGQGFVVGRESVDKTTAPYDVFKTALYDGRIEAPEHAKAMSELAGLERDQKTGRIDHRPLGSKDVSDAMACVAFGLTMQSRVWADFGIEVNRIPETIVEYAARHGRDVMEGAVGTEEV